MKKLTVIRILLSALVATSPAVLGGASLEEMGQRCQEARERKIAPLREEAIEECMSNPRTSRTRERCERIYIDFGEGAGTVNGAFRPAMFIDLPECVEYFEAQDGQRNSGSRR
jgi:hypothetical protein